MEGGVCVTDDDELFHILLSLRSHGWIRHLPWPNTLVEPDPRGAFHEAFRFILPGYNVRPMEIAGAIGVEQLKRVPDLIDARRVAANRFRERLARIDGVRLQREVSESSWFGFGLVLEPWLAARRDTVVARLAASGVETRPIVAGNFVNKPVMSRLLHEPPPALPGAQEVDERGFYIGANTVDDAGLDRLMDSLAAAVA